MMNVKLGVRIYRCGVGCSDICDSFMDMININMGIFFWVDTNYHMYMINSGKVIEVIRA